MPDETKPPEPTDEVSPTTEPPRPTLIVGLGASAGGLEALEGFFDNLPADTGLAFVVVTHQAPGRPSLMPELLARHTEMPIVPVEGDTPIEPDHVYLTLPGSNLAVYHGTLQPVTETGRVPHPIDYFFRALAQDQRERAVGIVLSGTGTDGTLGLEEIKGASGMTMVQTEASARYAGMPHSAIMALQVDYVLPANELPEALLAYARGVRHHKQRPPIPPEEGERADLDRLFFVVRGRTGHDFSGYKRSTLNRRIERRMNVHQIDNLSDYVAFSRRDPTEIDRLFKELLIVVTSFFRDPEAFDALEQALVPLVAGKSDGDVLRVWVPGCGTGEEAYSIAIVLHEIMHRCERRLGLQIFATDIEPDAIDIARRGMYPDSIAVDVSPERLAKHFVREGNVFRVKKEIRESLVFAAQNLISDPPFTQLDLLSCRNLLIYLEGWVQQRLLPLFHYTLRPGGILFLGSSESVGSFAPLFESVDKRWKVYRRVEAEAPRAAELAMTLAHGRAPREVAVARPAGEAPHAAMAHVFERSLLGHLVPPTVLMHERGEIVHIHGRTGQFLEPAPGPQSQPTNIFNMARQGLQLDLAVAMRHAASTEGPVVREGVEVRTNGDVVAVDLRVERLTRPAALQGLYLVTFDRSRTVTAPEEATAAEIEPNDDGRQRQLEAEIQHIKQVHQSTVEELEAANEEARSTNEELQSTNEELQSTNEELETSKEEMQSLNEELQTVNAELEQKVHELSRAHDDMANLLNSTDIATVFLDRDMRIKRYTEPTKRVIRLIPSDVGRSIADLVPRIHYGDLVEDAREVLRTLVPKERDVQDEAGRSYLMRILPYRTVDNLIDGVVVTFVDITALESMRLEARRIGGALEASPTGLFAQDRNLRYEWAYGQMLGRKGDRIVGSTDADLLSSSDAKRLNAMKQDVLETGRSARKRVDLTVSGERKAYDVFVAPRRDDQGEIDGVSGVVTELATLEPSAES